MVLSIYVLEHIRFEDVGDGVPDQDSDIQSNDTDSDESSTDFHLVKSPRSVQEVAVTVQGPRDRHFVPVSLAFKDMWYSVPKPGDAKEELTLLKGISGFAEPEMITALMGSSGAGKTTLMDVIAGRKTGGVELAAQPSVLFLDEPTSGLDARAAKMIMDGVRNVADSGRTIVCTIHQPSFEVFQVFDRLLLLKRGGETVYFGDLGHRGRAIIDYFQAIDGVSPIPSEAYNPATWMFEVIGAGVGGPVEGDVFVKQLEPAADFVAVFKGSDLSAKLTADLDKDGITRPAHGVDALSFNRKRAASNSLQAQMLFQRFFRTYWRTPDYMLTRAFVYLVLALVFGLAYLDRDFDTYQGANAGVALVYTTTVFIGVVSFEAAIPMASEMRASFYRERASETYNSLWYFVGSSVVEIPYIAVVCLLFCAVFFPMAGFAGGLRFVLYWFHLSLHVLLQTYVGELLAIVLPDMGSAMSVGVIFSTVFFNAMGFNPPASTLPAGYKWLYEVMPTKFAFSIIGSLLFGQCEEPGDLACKPLRGELPPAFAEGTTIKEYIARVFLIKSEDMWFNFWLTLLYVAITRVLTLLALRFVNHQRKPAPPEGHKVTRRGSGRRGGRSRAPRPGRHSLQQAHVTAGSSHSSASSPRTAPSDAQESRAFPVGDGRTARDRVREAKRLAKVDELADIDNRISLAKFRGDQLEWCSLMGQRAMLEESDSDSDAYEEEGEETQEERQEAEEAVEHVCNCEHFPVRKAANTRELRQLAKRQDIAQIDHEMMQAKIEGDDFTYYSQMGLRMLAEEEDSESEQDEYGSDSESAQQTIRLDVPPSPPPIEYTQSAIDRPAPPTARQISYSLARSKVKVKRGARKGGAVFPFAQAQPSTTASSSDSRPPQRSPHTNNHGRGRPRHRRDRSRSRSRNVANPY